MRKSVFIIHHPDEDAYAGQLAGYLAAAGITARRAASLGNTSSGRAVISRQIESAGACVVLWSNVSCDDELVRAQTRHAVGRAVPALAVHLGTPSLPAPLGLPEVVWTAGAAAVVAEVRTLLAWDARESSEVRDREAVGISTRVPSRASALARSGWLAAALATVALAAVGVTQAASTAERGPWSPDAALVPAAATPVQAASPSTPGGPGHASLPQRFAPNPPAPVAVAAPVPELVAEPSAAVPAATLVPSGDDPAAVGVPAGELPKLSSTPSRAEKPTVQRDPLAGVVLPKGRIVQQLQIEGVDVALQVVDDGVRLYQLLGPGAAHLRTTDMVRTKRADRRYLDARVSADGNTLLTLDRETRAPSAGQTAARTPVRVAVWRRNHTGYWVTSQVRFGRVPAAAALQTTLTLSPEHAVTLVRWQGGAGVEPGVLRWQVATQRPTKKP